MAFLTPNFIDFEINKNGARNSIAHIKFDRNEDVREIVGGMCIDSTKITFKHLIDDNFIICAGNDGGFSEKNFTSFKQTHYSSQTGLGQHGLGLRASINKRMKYATKAKIKPQLVPYGCIITKNKFTGFSIIPFTDSQNGEQFSTQIDCDTYKGVDPKEYRDQYDLYKEYLKDEDGTLFYIPNYKNNETENKNDIKTLNQMFYLKIKSNELELFHNFEDIKLNPENCKLEINGFDTVKLGKIINKDIQKYLHNSKLFFIKKFLNTNEPSYFETNNKNTIQPLPFDHCNDFKSKHELKISAINCTNKEHQNFVKTYFGYNNMTHDMGFLIVKKKIVTNYKGFGWGERGTSEDFRKPIIFIEVDDLNDFCKTEANKSKLTLENMLPFFKNYLTFVKRAFDQTVFNRGNTNNQHKQQSQNSTVQLVKQSQNSTDQLVKQSQNSTDQLVKQSQNSTGQSVEQSQNSTGQSLEQSQNSTGQLVKQSQNSTGQSVEQSQNSTDQLVKQSQNSTGQSLEQSQNSTGQSLEQSQKSTDQSVEQSHQTNQQGNTEEKKNLKRKPFNGSQKNAAEAGQDNKDAISGIRLNRITNRVDYDHIDDNCSNNSDTNIQALLSNIHSIKSNERTLYDSIKDNPELYLIDQFVGILEAPKIKALYTQGKKNGKKTLTIPELLTVMKNKIISLDSENKFEKIFTDTDLRHYEC
jgi:hypothetical protein